MCPGVCLWWCHGLGIAHLSSIGCLLSTYAILFLYDPGANVMGHWQFVGLPQGHIFATRTLILSISCILRSNFDWNHGILDSELFDNGKLPLLHFSINFEEHTFLGLLLVIDHCILLDGLVGGMNNPGVPSVSSSCGELIIHFQGFPGFLQNVINVKQQNQLPFGIAFLEELLGGEIDAVPEQIAED